MHSISSREENKDFLALAKTISKLGRQQQKHFLNCNLNDTRECKRNGLSMFVIYRFEMDGLIFCYTAIGKYIKERCLMITLNIKKKLHLYHYVSNVKTM